MNFECKLLDVLFRRIPPERMINHIDHQARNFTFDHHKDVKNATFLRFAETTLHGYSEDEQIKFLNYLQDIVQQLSSEVNIPPSVFLVPVNFGRKILNIDKDEPTCKFSEVLLWRDAFLPLGQDLFTCSTIAFEDVISQRERSYFAWPATIKTDHNHLYGMLKSGVAENHCHLNGSTQSFAISWSKLMNYPDSSEEMFQRFDQMLQSTTTRGSEDNVKPIRERIRMAAMIRAILFKTLRKDAFVKKSSAEHDGIQSPPVRGEYNSYTEYNNAFYRHLNAAHYISDTISVLRQNYGEKIVGPDGSEMCLDYALEHSIFVQAKDSPYRLLAGERHFLYQCFRACFSDHFTDFEQDLFYCYLLLKSSFRSEMIQVNKQVGFQNFSNYELRNDVIYDDDRGYRWEAVRMALNAPLQQEHVISLETRFCPKGTAEALLRAVERFDLGKWFADQHNTDYLHFAEKRFEEYRTAGDIAKEPHFYVLHYPKHKDEPSDAKQKYIPKCRHEKLRAEIKSKTLATVEALSNSDYLCSRIRGIDGCASEVECRAEVFATAFRFFNHFSPGLVTVPGCLLGSPVSKISSTYHAGEDFYDILDGLRAIDEAVYFLELKRGSRIGHALAMGVDPETHYRTKSNNIILPKQNYLDNLVWLLYRKDELGIHIDHAMQHELENKAKLLLREIYGDALHKNGWKPDLQVYYYSMKLRGDAPELYMTMRFMPPFTFGCEYDRCGISHTHMELHDLRKDPEIAGLYYYYHYGFDEKTKGSKPEIVSITPKYIEMVRCVQNALQVYLERLGLTIECNPSSNVLIGTFGDYSKHPIFRLNNYGLSHSDQDYNPQMQVCVNTDDLGVFDTSLTFEYALLANALFLQEGSNGKPLHPDAEIIRYLDELRKMGLQSVFPSVGPQKGPIYRV